MAILKHISVHNSNYSAAVLYFMYQHDNHARPIYDEAGLMIERENLLIDGINTTPYEYSYDCKDISRKYGKNRTKDEVKSHHWIISFDPRDVTDLKNEFQLICENSVTRERTRKLKAFQKKLACLTWLESKVQSMIQFSDSFAA